MRTSVLAAALPLALIAYFLSIFLASLAIAYRSRLAHQSASAGFVVAWLAHLSAVLYQGWLTRSLPLNNRSEYLLVLGWAVMSLHLWLWFRHGIQVAGLLLPPLAALAAGMALPTLASVHPAAARPGGWAMFHATVSTLGMATLCVALAMSVLYLVHDRALKSHRKLRLLERLPSLERCDRLGLQALAVGLALFSVGIVTGIGSNLQLHARLWVAGAKQTFPLLAWLLLAAILGARLALGFRGRKSAYLIITGVALGLLTALGMAL